METSHKIPSYAIPQEADGFLGKILRDTASSHSGLSGFSIFETGEESLHARLFLIMAAEKTLDLQYYAISEGISSNLIIEAVIRAAKRGVRVRLMVDDVTTGPMRRSLSALDGINNIEIRVFNPINKYDQSPLARFISAVTHVDRATRRMHNKALISDNLMAIIGGRNLGDEYFDAHEEIAFKDIDVLSAGPITTKISDSFDEFWNDQQSIPLIDLHKKRRANLQRIYALRRKLRANWRRFLRRESLKAPDLTDQDFLQHIENMVWAEAEMIADPSAKAKARGNEGFSPPLRRLKEIVDAAKREFIIISAYFVPRDNGLAWLKSLCERGMSVKILTNSLASTDVVAVHAGYRRYREALLENNASIFELKPRGPRRTRQRLIARRSPSYASLHAKAYVVDNEYAIIGSFNFDPRSAFLNTEIGLFIRSPQLADQLRRMYEESTSPDTSYKVGLGPGKKLLWAARENGEDVRYEKEPKASIWRIFQVFLISLLPVEDQL